MLISLNYVTLSRSLIIGIKAIQLLVLLLCWLLLYKTHHPTITHSTFHYPHPSYLSPFSSLNFKPIPLSTHK
ncbi:hypothetical protein RIF29_27805 [Crotalaria pallida]|uniref:Uncharacterized protein n=1 Tax=Crotalaria pallida TaxID=3830 RepID=A0AAN9EQ97_CROPI